MGGTKGSSKGARTTSAGKGPSSASSKGGKTSTVTKPVTKEVHKPWVKLDTKSYSSYSGSSNKPSGKGGSNGRDSWSSGRSWSSDRKGKGKGKGKRRFAAPLSSKFWERKEEEENREVIGSETFAGVIQRYSVKQGWGFIMPDYPNDLPQEVKDRLAKSCKEAEAEGKEVSDPNHLYFRKPDVNHTDGFKLSKDAPVTFSVYVDDKGAGACDVSMA
mmetsp:Transcript_77123/g.229784  ORF Transcript_77123/g.229784 Transcript_77123/m.229784 type:complete len:216 (+) Transcript_77123:79-726(+)|eukprot:CAMPEP_0175227136 /NCGR_PEP_ID=MMETSP0093-20121207/23252_1 /TAXON_ID=311494 /ORGANISM="Alexandrium monilatum, Strain CCMP3105" /LENGTH=215 /DNA_ID=CAMNT_0016520881 /DNA_START=79 /DNA_END=726 /DNA_ORIENTATION=-